MPLVEFWCVCC